MQKQAKKNHVNVPVIMQLEAVECGAVCLAMILAYYKKWLPIEKVRHDCGVSRDGSNAGNILKAANNYGLSTKAYRLEPQELKDNVAFPCIIHWNFNHFVVLCGFGRGKVLINDPARGRIWVSDREFDEAFTGICLCFAPNESFEKSGRRKSMLSFIGKRLTGAGSAVAFVTATAFVVSVIEIIYLSLSKVFEDGILGGSYAGYLIPFVLLLCMLGIVWAVILGTKEAGMLKISGKFSASGSGSFMWKILHLPLEFFSQRISVNPRNAQIIIHLTALRDLPGSTIFLFDHKNIQTGTSAINCSRQSRRTASYNYNIFHIRFPFPLFSSQNQRYR